MWIRQRFKEYRCESDKGLNGTVWLRQSFKWYRYESELVMFTLIIFKCNIVSEKVKLKYFSSFEFVKMKNVCIIIVFLFYFFIFLYIIFFLFFLFVFLVVFLSNFFERSSLILTSNIIFLTINIFWIFCKTSITI